MKTIYLLACLFLCGAVEARTPVCWPDASIPMKLHYEVLPSGASSTMQYVAVWACKTPTGYVNETWALARKEIENFVPAFLAGKFNETDATAVCAKTCETYRGDTSLTFAMRAIAKPYLARAEVTASGTATSRSVYTLKSDGTRNTTAVSNARVAVQAGCNTNARVGSTSYYRVDGNPNVATADPADILKGVVAQCSISLPLGANE